MRDLIPITRDVKANCPYTRQPERAKKRRPRRDALCERILRPMLVAVAAVVARCYPALLSRRSSRVTLTGSPSTSRRDRSTSLLAIESISTAITSASGE